MNGQELPLQSIAMAGVGEGCLFAFQPEERMCAGTFLSNPSHTCYPRVFWGDVKTAGLQRPQRMQGAGRGEGGRVLWLQSR